MGVEWLEFPEKPKLEIEERLEIAESDVERLQRELEVVRREMEMVKSSIIRILTAAEDQDRESLRATSIAMLRELSSDYSTQVDKALFLENT